MKEKTLKRFWDKVNKNGTIGKHRPDLGPCWLWTACIKGGSCGGYGSFNLKGKTTNAHRLAYELLIGPIPKGLYCDHLCRVRHCVNPYHLELKTHIENILSPGSLIFQNGKHEKIKTHCPQGHEYTKENTRIFRGSRYCKECTRAYDRKRGSKRNALAKHRKEKI